MKQLLLLRHGDAIRGAAGTSDHQRPLSGEGVREAAGAGAWLMSSGRLPDSIFCSTALRTRQTLEALRLPAELTARAAFCDALYHASPNEMILTLQSAPEPAARVLLIGHNPGLRDFCEAFGKEGDAAAREAIDLGYKTAALAGLEFDVARWHDLPGDNGTLVFYRTPEG